MLIYSVYCNEFDEIGHEVQGAKKTKGVFAGLIHPNQPADPLSKYYSSTSRYSISLSQNQSVSVKFQTSERDLKMMDYWYA